MTAPRIAMPDGKPDNGTVFFVYRAERAGWVTDYPKPCPTNPNS